MKRTTIDIYTCIYVYEDNGYPLNYTGSREWITFVSPQIDGYELQRKCTNFKLYWPVEHFGILCYVCGV